MVTAVLVLCVVAVLATTASCTRGDKDRCGECIKMVDYAVSLESDEAETIIYKTICSSLKTDSAEEFCRRLFRKLTSRDACYVLGECNSRYLEDPDRFWP